MALTLARALRSSPAACVAFVGAGGKSTAMFQLARELKPPVLVTTTTHLGIWQIPLADEHIIADNLKTVRAREFRGLSLLTGPIQGNDRLGGISDEILSWLHEEQPRTGFSLLIEADGSHQKPLKAPAEHEPAIPGFADTVVVVAGLSALGLPLGDETVHRPEIFSRLTGLDQGDAISSEAIIKELTHPMGGLKNIPDGARRVALLNQADTPGLQSIGGRLAASLLGAFDAILVGAVRDSEFQTIEQTAGIVLAAGESKRFGAPKQLLDWRGEPFVRVIAKTALDAGLSPVIVVTGSNAEQVEAVVMDLNVTIVRNQEWQSGQAGSIRAGLRAIAERGARGQVGSAVFLLADQPQVTASVVRALVEHHSTGLYPIVAPLILMEQRANPVLFDRLTFPDLLGLQGDVGGRGIFSRHRVEYLPWHDDSLLFDVDRPEDYPRMKELE
jgi:molybdenum cofactor cytidylyltransferase